MRKEVWLIWKSSKTRRGYKIGVLSYDQKYYSFQYVDPELNEARNDGFRFFPGFDDVKKIYTSERLFTNIKTRLPNSKRRDYLEILNSYNLTGNATELEILEATRGRLITDNYEFVPSFHKDKIEFDVVGTRHCSDIKLCRNLIHMNDRLLFEIGDKNPYDEHAIKMILHKDGKNYHVGYVPRYYAKEITELLKSNVKYSALVASLNFESQFNDEYITVTVKLIFDTN